MEPRNPFRDIPVSARKWGYLLYSAVVVALGALHVGWSSAGEPQPMWLQVSTEVVGYLGVTLGITAVSNLPPHDEDPPPGD